MSEPLSPEQAAVSQLRDELRQREYEIALLRETALAIGTELDLETVFKLIADRAIELVQSETLLIPILDEACDVYTYRAGAGENAEEIVGESLPLEFGVCGWVWRHKKPWWRGVLNELTPDERNRWEKEAGTLILVPLVGHKHFLGGIAAINKRGGGDFTERDLHILELFAGHAAIAIENAMAMQEAEETQRTLENYQHELQKLNRRLSHANQELEYLSLYDQLTGLPNRSLFRDRVRQQLDVARRSSQGFAVLIADLDGFQVINDEFGHEGGDLLLKTVAERFTAVLGADDTLCRMSGDEFAVLVCDSDGANAINMANRLRETLGEPIALQDHQINVGATVGIALYPAHGDGISELVKHADVAMNAGKREKNGVHLFDATHDNLATGRIALFRDLQNALDRDEFELHYQPKIALATGTVVGVEALSRWHHASRGMIPTEMFISALEQTGLIARFSYRVIESALEQRAAWLAQGWDIKIAVNIPITLLLDAHFADELERIMRRHVGLGGLIFEITESIFLSNYDHLNNVLREISRFDIELSIDDFGTGHSSLSRLRQLPVTELKIDRSFVVDMLRNKDDAAIVKSTIDLAHNLGLQAVAEGVESSPVMEQLYRLRCDVVQGYHISKALSSAKMSQFIAESKWGVPGHDPGNQQHSNDEL